MEYDCIVFESDKEPYVIKVDEGQISVNFGRNDKGMPVSRRIGGHLLSSPGKQETYLYVYSGEDQPNNSELSAAIASLRPRPYEK